MTILKDISSVLKEAKNIVKELNMTTKPDQTSLARMSSATTLQFPVIVSRSIDTDTAQSITKALERQYAIFVQMVISLNPYLDLQNDSMPAYLKRIHQNSPTPIDLLESCTNVYSDEVYGIYMMTSINNGSNGTIVKSNKDQMFTIEEHLNPTKINGVCGRLMCCLKYEDEIYEEIRNSMKQPGEKINTEYGEGTITSLDVLNKKYKVNVPNYGTIEININESN